MSMLMLCLFSYERTPQAMVVSLSADTPCACLLKANDRSCIGTKGPAPKLQGRQCSSYEATGRLPAFAGL